MKTKTWGILGSLAVNLMLGLVVAAVFSVAPVAKAGESHACAAHAAAHTRPTPAQPAPAPQKRSYLTAVRMGWAAG
jgi:hypothetical protein